MANIVMKSGKKVPLARFAKGGEVTAPRAAMIAKQPHMLAYINQDEEALLRSFGGSGIAGPKGIPSYPPDSVIAGDIAARSPSPPSNSYNHPKSNTSVYGSPSRPSSGGSSGGSSSSSSRPSSSSSSSSSRPSSSGSSGGSSSSSSSSSAAAAARARAAAAAKAKAAAAAKARAKAKAEREENEAREALAAMRDELLTGGAGDDSLVGGVGDDNLSFGKDPATGENLPYVKGSRVKELIAKKSKEKDAPFSLANIFGYEDFRDMIDGGGKYGSSDTFEGDFAGISNALGATPVPEEPSSRAKDVAKKIGEGGGIGSIFKGIGADLAMGFKAGMFANRDQQRKNLLEAGYKKSEIDDYFKRTDETIARNQSSNANAVDPFDNDGGSQAITSNQPDPCPDGYEYDPKLKQCVISTSGGGGGTDDEFDDDYGDGDRGYDYEDANYEDEDYIDFKLPGMPDFELENPFLPRR